MDFDWSARISSPVLIIGRKYTGRFGTYCGPNGGNGLSIRIRLDDGIMFYPSFHSVKLIQPHNIRPLAATIAARRLPTVGPILPAPITAPSTSDLNQASSPAPGSTAPIQVALNQAAITAPSTSDLNQASVPDPGSTDPIQVALNQAAVQNIAPAIVPALNQAAIPAPIQVALNQAAITAPSTSDHNQASVPAPGSTAPIQVAPNQAAIPAPGSTAHIQVALNQAAVQNIAPAIVPALNQAAVQTNGTTTVQVSIVAAPHANPAIGTTNLKISIVIDKFCCNVGISM